MLEMKILYRKKGKKEIYKGSKKEFASSSCKDVVDRDR